MPRGVHNQNQYGLSYTGMIILALRNSDAVIASPFFNKALTSRDIYTFLSIHVDVFRKMNSEEWADTKRNISHCLSRSDFFHRYEWTAEGGNDFIPSGAQRDAEKPGLWTMYPPNGESEEKTWERIDKIFKADLVRFRYHLIKRRLLKRLAEGRHGWKDTEGGWLSVSQAKKKMLLKDYPSPSPDDNFSSDQSSQLASDDDEDSAMSYEEFISSYSSHLQRSDPSLPPYPPSAHMYPQGVPYGSGTSSSALPGQQMPVQYPYNGQPQQMLPPMHQQYRQPPQMMQQQMLPPMHQQYRQPPQMMQQQMLPPMHQQYRQPPQMMQQQMLPPMDQQYGQPPQMMQQQMLPPMHQQYRQPPQMMQQQMLPPMHPQYRQPPQMMQQQMLPPMDQQYGQPPQMMQQQMLPPMHQQYRQPPQMMQQQMLPPMDQQYRQPPQMMQQQMLPPMDQQYGQPPQMMQQQMLPPMLQQYGQPQQMLPPMHQQYGQGM